MAGRPKEGKEVKVVVSARLQPREKKLLIRMYGSITNALKFALKQESPGK